MAAHLANLKEEPVPFSRPATPGYGAHTVGCIGLGNMGAVIAKNLANHRSSSNSQNSPLPPIVVWNRTQKKSQQLLTELGSSKIRVAENLAQIVHECDIILSNLSNDVVTKEIYEQLAAILDTTPPSKPKTFVEMSTIYPVLAGELDTLITRSNTSFIMCPVFGAPPVAERRELLIVMSGDYRAKKEVAHLLVPAVGRKVIDLGGNVEKAPTFKLIGNSLILGSLEVLAEGFTLAEKSGIGASNVQDLIKDLLPAPLLVAYGHKMANDEFDGTHGFAIDNGIKDASHIRRLTAERNSPMPVIDLAHQHLITTRALNKHTFDPLDWSSIIAATRVSAGLDAFDSNKHTNVVHED